MITLKSAYKLRALVRTAIQYAKDSKSGVGSLSSTMSSLGISVDLYSGARTVSTYIGDNYIEMSKNTVRWNVLPGEERNTWGDDTHPAEWWGNNGMPNNPCDVTLDSYEESLFQFEVLHSGSMLESSMYGLVIRAVLDDLLDDYMCIIIQRWTFGMKDTPIDPNNVNDLIDAVYYKHLGTTEVQYV